MGIWLIVAWCIFVRVYLGTIIAMAIIVIGTWLNYQAIKRADHER